MDVEILFYLPLENISPNEILRAFETVISNGSNVVANDRFCLTTRRLPPMQRLPYPVSQASPDFSAVLFGIEDDGSTDGFSASILPKRISEDGLWLYSVHWRACLRWKSCSYASLNKRARGIMRLIGGAEQVPEAAHGIVHLALQEWPRSDVRELRWAKIIEEISQFYHSAKFRLPYMFVNRLIARVNQNGGPDIEENCVILRDEHVGDSSEMDRLPHRIFTADA